MEDFRKIDDKLYYARYCDKKVDKLYYARYCDKKVGNPEEIWSSIKSNRELLEWAIKPTKDKFGERDLVNGLAICEDILVDFNNVDNEVYQKLVDLIYSNRQIARIVLDGYSNGGYSYLLMTLYNPNLKLTDEQKTFAVDEAMNKIGTVRHESDTQAHGSGDFDIRYWILRNPNWSLEEKQKLIMDFWSDDEDYDETLEQWEWGIVNDHANYKGNPMPLFERDELYEYSYDALLKFYDDKVTTDRIWEEIQFCKQMHQLRPQQWESESAKRRVLEKVIQN